MMFYDHSFFAASEHTASVETAQVPLVVRKFVISLFEVRFHPSSKLNEWTTRQPRNSLETSETTSLHFTSLAVSLFKNWNPIHSVCIIPYNAKEPGAMEKFLQGISDSTLGDRAKAVKTYREFVVPWLSLMEQWTKAPGWLISVWGLYCPNQPFIIIAIVKSAASCNFGG